MRFNCAYYQLNRSFNLIVLFHSLQFIHENYPISKSIKVLFNALSIELAEIELLEE